MQHNSVSISNYCYFTVFRIVSQSRVRMGVLLSHFCLSLSWMLIVCTVQYGYRVLHCSRGSLCYSVCLYLSVPWAPILSKKKILLVKTKLFTKDLTKSPRSVLSRGENGRKPKKFGKYSPSAEWLWVNETRSVSLDISCPSSQRVHFCFFVHQPITAFKRRCPI